MNKVHLEDKRSPNVLYNFLFVNSNYRISITMSYKSLIEKFIYLLQTTLLLSVYILPTSLQHAHERYGQAHW